jgi:hypothetical protein
LLLLPGHSDDQDRSEEAAEAASSGSQAETLIGAVLNSTPGGLNDRRVFLFPIST